MTMIHQTKILTWTQISNVDGSDGGDVSDDDNNDNDYKVGCGYNSESKKDDDVNMSRIFEQIDLLYSCKSSDLC